MIDREELKERMLSYNGMFEDNALGPDDITLIENASAEQGTYPVDEICIIAAKYATTERAKNLCRSYLDDFINSRWEKAFLDKALNEIE